MGTGGWGASVFLRVKTRSVSGQGKVGEKEEISGKQRKEVASSRIGASEQLEMREDKEKIRGKRGRRIQRGPRRVLKKRKLKENHSKNKEPINLRRREDTTTV